MPKPIDMEDATLDGINAMHHDKNCYLCRHYLSRSDNCPAFPDQIPNKFLTAMEVHDEPEPGDNGIRFEAKEKKQRASRKSARRKK